MLVNTEIYRASILARPYKSSMSLYRLSTNHVHVSVLLYKPFVWKAFISNQSHLNIDKTSPGHEDGNCIGNVSWCFYDVML